MDQGAEFDGRAAHPADVGDEPLLLAGLGIREDSVGDVDDGLHRRDQLVAPRRQQHADGAGRG